MPTVFNSGVRTARAPATDAFCEEVVDIFLDGEVIFICREIVHLLTNRYASAATLLGELCFESHDEARAVIEHSGRHCPALRTLKNFGLILGDAQSLWVPEVFRWYLRTFTNRPQAGRA